jgi:hypothetical protein
MEEECATLLAITPGIWFSVLTKPMLSLGSRFFVTNFMLMAPLTDTKSIGFFADSLSTPGLIMTRHSVLFSSQPLSA